MKRRAFTFALLASLAGCTTPAFDDAASSDESNLTSTGEWGAPVSLRDTVTTDVDVAMPDGGFWVTPIHVTLLPSGNVFVTGWSRVAKDACTFPEGSRRNGVSFILDPADLSAPANEAARSVALTPLDEHLPNEPPWKRVLYCAGHAPVVVDGESGILLTGGSRYLNLGEPGREVEEGLRSAHLAFGDRATPSIEPLSDIMKSGPICQRNDGQELAPGESQARGGKWYATNTRMPDGTVLVTGGFTGGPTSTCVQNRHSASAEIFDPRSQTFRALFQPEDLPEGFGERFAPGDKDYTHTLLLPEPVVHGGRRYQVAMMGYAGFIVLMSTDPDLEARDRFYVPPNGSRPDNAMAWDSTMALVSTGEILVVGGTSDATTATKIHLYDPKTDQWTSIDTLIGRRNAGATLLPDGRVLLINGWRDDSPSLGLDQRTRPIIFDPETRSFETFDGYSGDHERGYHSFSLLGKDGSIYVGGGIYPGVATPNAPKPTDIGCERTDVQTWKPPYLAPATGPRPVIDAEDHVELGLGGSPMRVRFHGAALDRTKGAALMALGSFTHGFDQNQRYVRLGLDIEGDTAVIAPPTSASAAPPGDYLLFLVSDRGVPSIAKHVRVTR
jgi:hypothetical protein